MCFIDVYIGYKYLFCTLVLKFSRANSISLLSWTTITHTCDYMNTEEMADMCANLAIINL